MNKLLVTILLIPSLCLGQTVQTTIAPNTLFTVGDITTIAVEGNLVNGSAGVTFGSSSTISLSGTSNQGLATTSQLNIPILTINGGADKAFFGNIFVTSALNLNSGLVFTQNFDTQNSFIIRSGASINKNGDSWVVGPLAQQGTGEKIFPIGTTSQYAPAILDNVRGNDNTISGMRVFRNDGSFNLTSLPTGVDTVSQAWVWAAFARDFSGTNVTLPILPEDQGLISGDDLLHVILEADTSSNASENLGGFTGGSIDGGFSAITTENESVNPGGDFVRLYLLGAKRTTVPIIHNIITPNGDGSNDYLIIDAISVYGDSNEVIILDRWGVEVYRKTNFANFNDFDNPYDGSFDDFSPGNYICILKYGGQTAKQVITVLN